MNPILQVKLRFNSEGNKQKPGPRNLKANSTVSSDKLDRLINNLKAILRYYRSTDILSDRILIDVEYNDIIAKSNRIKAMLKPIGKTTNEAIVGARFSDANEGEENHIITYYVDVDVVKQTISDIEEAKRFLSVALGGKATTQNFKEPGFNLDYSISNLAKTKVRDIIIDCAMVEELSVPHISNVPDKDSFLVTFYKTDCSLSELFEKLNIDEIKYKYAWYGDDTISVTKELFKILEERVPYLISMVSSDFSTITFDEIVEDEKKEEIFIPEPNQEPIIGVIDTLFDESVYFSKWVENVDYLDEIEKLMYKEGDRNHGTAVSSVIVDGPRLNPWLDDGCGRFRVKHFGVCVDTISTSKLVKKMREIVDNNPGIHVWNLSLGTEDEISKNFISYDGSFLDALQAEKNVIFVVSGTNDNRDIKNPMLKVGSPADSLNSVVVNSVKRDGKPASYSRKGQVLSFFNKPDVSYYGGDYNERITVFTPRGEEGVYGTSFAAPWISRKLCYLIDVMGMPREIAKAKLIDAAAGWDYKKNGFKYHDVMGYGIVPISILDILSVESDEIQFTLYGNSESFNTNNYTIPIPKDDDNKYPFIARATMCYFPECSRSQGVDYTNRELSIQFGRVKSDGKIADINENVQDEEGAAVDERKSRKDFRKWENTKFISRVVKKNKPLASYEDRLWGIKVTSKERLSTKTIRNLNFGIVITLKELNGVNRIQDFIAACTLRAIIVNELNVSNQIEVYNTNQEEIVFE